MASTKTNLTFEGAGEFQAPGHGGDYSGRNFHFGIREHAMCAFTNGMALSGLRPYGSSFLVFTDYCRGALRISALMEVPAIYIWTHDSINLGEDGPTHQPIEHLASLRAMPGMIVLRPADANEVVEAWRVIMGIKDRPVCLVLTRALPLRPHSACGGEWSPGRYVWRPPSASRFLCSPPASRCALPRGREGVGRGDRRAGRDHAVGRFRGAPGRVPRHVLPPEIEQGLGGSGTTFGWRKSPVPRRI